LLVKTRSDRATRNGHRVRDDKREERQLQSHGQALQ